MPRSKKKGKPAPYSTRAEGLKKLKLIPQSYNAKKLTESQKRHVRRVEQKLKKQKREHGEFIVSHPDKYIAGTTSSAKAAKNYRRQGYTVKRTGKKYTVIDRRLEGQKKLTVKDDGTIRRKLKNRTITSYPDTKAKEILERIERFFKNPKKAGRYLTLKVGGASPFARVITSLEDFYKYHDIFERIARNRKLRNQLQIVEVNPEDADDEGEE